MDRKIKLSPHGNSSTLYIIEATVKSHLVHIFDKLGVTDRTAAATTALERKIIHLGSAPIVDNARSNP